MPATTKIIRKRRHVIFLIHGIRTQGEWATRAAAVLESDPTIRVRPIRYEFLDVIRFLVPLPRFRNKSVHRVTRLIRDELSQEPDAFSVIAHSFGSYIISKILENEPDIVFHRMVLCGSIIPDGFDWGRFGHRLHSDSEGSWQVINECGMQDIWPVMAKSVTWGYGSSGRFGFGHPRVKDRFYNVGHSGFFTEEFVRKRWLPYFVKGEIVQGILDRPTNPWWVSVLTVFKLRAILLLLLLFFGGRGVVHQFYLTTGTKPPTTIEEPANHSYIRRLERDIVELDRDYERLDTHQELKTEVRRKAISLKRRFENISDSSLDPFYRMSKYKYILYLCTVVASLGDNNYSETTPYIDRGRQAGKQAIASIEEIQKNAALGEKREDQILYDNILSDGEVEKEINEFMKELDAIRLNLQPSAPTQ